MRQIGGSEIAGNVIAGLALGWLAQYFFPGIKPWGYAVGILLGAASGFYQVIKASGGFGPMRSKKKDGDGKPDQP